MNNIISYCGLVDTRISASEKYLPVTPFFLVESDSERNPVVRIVPKEPVAKSRSSSPSSSSDTESLNNADTNSRNDQILCQKSLGETISDSPSKAVDVVEVPEPLLETPTPEATATVDKSSSEDESHQQETEINISQPEVSDPIIVLPAESENFREKAESISSKKSSSSSSSESERYHSYIT